MGQMEPVFGPVHPPVVTGGDEEPSLRTPSIIAPVATVPLRSFPVERAFPLVDEAHDRNGEKDQHGHGRKPVRPDVAQL